MRDKYREAIDTFLGFKMLDSLFPPKKKSAMEIDEMVLGLREQLRCRYCGQIECRRAFVGCEENFIKVVPENFEGMEYEVKVEVSQDKKPVCDCERCELID